MPPSLFIQFLLKTNYSSINNNHQKDSFHEKVVLRQKIFLVVKRIILFNSSAQNLHFFIFFIDTGGTIILKNLYSDLMCFYLSVHYCKIVYLWNVMQWRISIFWLRVIHYIVSNDDTLLLASAHVIMSSIVCSQIYTPAFHYIIYYFVILFRVR